MKLKPYPKYKESGVQWIGEVPEGWEVQRSKYQFKIIGGYAFSSDDFVDAGVPIIRIGDISGGTISLDDCKRMPKEYALTKKNFLIEEKDVLIAMTGATIGKIGQVTKTSEKMLLNQRVGKIKTKLSSDYYKYVLNADFIQSQIKLIAEGSAQENISNEQIESFVIPNLDKQNQDFITHFLDLKTSEISKTIEADKKLIELLKEKRTALINHVVTKGLNPKAKMKDSGIEWIGEVPEGWEVKKIKYFTVEKRNKATELDESGHFVGLENIEPMSGKVFSYNSTENMEGESLKFKKNQVLFCKLRPYLAKVVVADIDGFCTSELIIYECDKKTNPTYLRYRLLSNGYIDYVNSLTEGVKMPRADPVLLSNIKLPLPPLSEQLQISSYLDKSTSKIDQTIQKIEEKIEFLEEYKKSLIHHVVTGKVDVRDAVA